MATPAGGRLLSLLFVQAIAIVMFTLPGGPSIFACAAADRAATDGAATCAADEPGCRADPADPADPAGLEDDLAGAEDTPGAVLTPWRDLQSAYLEIGVDGIVETLVGTLMGTNAVPAGAGPAIATQESDSDRPSGRDSAGGIAPGPPAPAEDDVACVRRAFRCAEWAEAGECSNNPQFMNNVCYRDCQ